MKVVNVVNVDNAHNRPAQIFRRGAIGLSLWQRDGQQGPYFEFTVSRSFRKGEDEAGYTGNLRTDNIEGLRAVLDEAEAWLTT